MLAVPVPAGAAGAVARRVKREEGGRLAARTAGRPVVSDADVVGVAGVQQAVRALPPCVALVPVPLVPLIPLALVPLALGCVLSLPCGVLLLADLVALRADKLRLRRVIGRRVLVLYPAVAYQFRRLASREVAIFMNEVRVAVPPLRIHRYLQLAPSPE